MKKYQKLIIAAATVILIVSISYFTNITQYLSLKYLQQEDHFLRVMIKENYYCALLVYIAIFSAIIGLGIPGSPALTLFGGYLFGIKLGTLYATISSVIGATASFLVFRYFLKETVRSWEGPRIQRLQRKLETNGFMYLLMMHFVVIIPYFIINAVAALSTMPLLHFIIITIIGSFPLIIVYAFAGQQLSSISSINDIFSWHILGALTLLIGLTLLPIIIQSIRAKKTKN